MEKNESETKKDCEKQSTKNKLEEFCFLFLPHGIDRPTFDMCVTTVLYFIQSLVRMWIHFFIHFIFWIIDKTVWTKQPSTEWKKYMCVSKQASILSIEYNATLELV